MSFIVDVEDYAGRKITFDQVGKRLQRTIAKQTRDQCRNILDSGAINIRNNIIRGMRDSPPTGKLYFRGTRTSKKGKATKVFHRASSPGNYPRVDSGDLVQSIGITRGIDEIQVGSRIFQDPYPYFLEVGTDNMEPRPWLGPSFDKEEGTIKQRLRAVLDKAVSDFTRGSGR